MTDNPPIRVVSQEEAEQASYVVCVPADFPTPFTDNERGECCACGCAIVFRPTAPKKPPRICMKCAVDLAQANIQ